MCRVVGAIVLPAVGACKVAGWVGGYAAAEPAGTERSLQPDLPMIEGRIQCRRRDMTEHSTWRFWQKVDSVSSIASWSMALLGAAIFVFVYFSQR